MLDNSFPLTDTVDVPLKDLNDDFTCPVCLNIIRNTTTVMECLHRFCDNCIETSLRLGLKECPACRCHCASRRNLRKDCNFDEIIELIHSNPIQAAEEKDKMAQQIIRSHDHQAFGKSVYEGTMFQKQSSRHFRANRPEGPIYSKKRKLRDIPNINLSNFITFTLTRISDTLFDPFEGLFVRTEKSATVELLCKLLAKKFEGYDDCFYDHELCCISINSEILPLDSTLDYIEQIYWQANDHRQLQYEFPSII